MLDKVSLPIYEIRPPRGWAPINFKDLWHHRELLYFFTWRDVKVRYKQSILGFAWALIVPFMMMVVFTLFFGNLAQVPSEGIPYPLFNYCALLPWTLFSEGITRSSNSLVLNASLIKKVYFPRLIIPTASILSPFVDFVIAFVILIGMMFYFGYIPTVNMFWLPAFIVMAMLTSLGVGLWLTAINAKYRDVRYIVPFLVQLWLFASPVVYSSTLLPSRYQLIYGLNPMSGVIEGFRWAALGTTPPDNLILVSLGITIVLVITGVLYFRRTERTLPDVI